MPWQTADYYMQEAETLTEPEFRRIHRNEWVDSEETAIPLEAWDACRGDLPPVDPSEPLVIALDASVSGDYTALVVASPHPADKGKDSYRSAIRSVETWKPPKGKKIDYNHTLLPSLVNWCTKYNVVCVVYDPFQLEHLANTQRVVLGQWFAEFPQGKGSRSRPGRLIGDKAFYDMVITKKVVHGGDPTLRRHVRNAAGRSTGVREHLRFVKKADYLKIDALVAAAMACFEVQRLNLG
jgi:phage terminase large subunit-like protein